jgi:phosphate transport system permease protein
MPPASAPAPARKPIYSVSRRVKIIDRAADLFIRLGGLGIIVIVALIFVFIGLQTLPLFRPAQGKLLFAAPLPDTPGPDQVLALGINEYESHLYYLDAAAGAIRFVNVETKQIDRVVPLPALQGHPAVSAYRTPSRDKIVIGTADGRMVFASVSFKVDYAADNSRTVTASGAEIGKLEVDPEGKPLTRVHTRTNSNGDFLFAAATADGRLFTGKFVEDEGGEAALVPAQLEGRINSVAIDYEGNRFFVSTDQARLYQWYLDNDRETPFKRYDLPSPITTMDFLIGDTALLFGFQDGKVESWFGVREKETDVLKPLRRIHIFEPLPAAVVKVQPSGRDKGFLAGGIDGTVRLYFSTSERTLLNFKLGAGLRDLVYAPKLTAWLALDTAKEFQLHHVDNPHPEISLKALFGKVHYEGYDKPDYIWQSTGGTDDFEAKFNLVPLVIGTLKGAFYGLLFAIPVAVFAALYTSQFMAPSLRTTLKPTIEIMAALPSVVIGFLAGLWLAPLLEEIMVGTMLAVVAIPLVVLVFVCVWQVVPPSLRRRVPDGREFFVLVPLVIAGFMLAQWLGPYVDAFFFKGNYKQWVFDTFGQQFEQRNSLVIGIAMGFAVIPIIFTISEDAFSNVPTSFKSASYALGASKWQTAWRVILPTASPGVFSAVMIGFGRAVGETMIVLMATGNTPIMSFSPFNGMRTLSANIAVEIPEAPADGTLYRVLFVAALLLFLLTFAVNTVAEVVRQRLRTRYQAV